MAKSSDEIYDELLAADLDHVGPIIRVLRHERHLSVDTLAKEVAITPKSLDNLETGGWKRKPTFEQLRRFADVLGAPARDERKTDDDKGLKWVQYVVVPLVGVVATIVVALIGQGFFRDDSPLTPTVAPSPTVLATDNPNEEGTRTTEIVPPTSQLGGGVRCDQDGPTAIALTGRPIAARLRPQPVGAIACPGRESPKRCESGDNSANMTELVMMGLLPPRRDGIGHSCGGLSWVPVPANSPTYSVGKASATGMGVAPAHSIHAGVTLPEPR